MKMFAMFLSVLVMTLTFTGCNSTNDTGCAIETTVTTALSSALATALTCKNASVMQSDIQAALGKANLCAAATTQAQLKSSGIVVKGVVGNIVCPLAVSAVSGLISSKIPATWGCTVASGSSIATVLTTACEAVVPL